MTSLEKNKLQAKIAKQQAKQDDLFGSYTLGQKRVSRVRFSNNGLWKHNDLDKNTLHEVVINGKIYKKLVK